MKFHQSVVVALCILYTIQISLVASDQALGTRISSMSLDNTANRDRLISGIRSAGAQNHAPSFQIWVKGINPTEFNVVKSAITAAGCNLVSSNINNQYKALPHFNYVVARVRCSTQAKWTTLASNRNFYSRVAFSERSYFTDNLQIESILPGTAGSRCAFPAIPPYRIASWQGKVNQHTTNMGIWSTDIDGVSGAEINKLTYCKKFYPQTTGWRNYKNEIIGGWRDRGNVGGPYTREVMTYECIQPVNNNCNRKRFNPEENPIYFPDEQQIESMRQIQKEMEIAQQNYLPEDIAEMTVEDLLDFEARRPQCLEPVPMEPYILKRTGNETEVELKRIARLEKARQACPPNPPPPYYPPPYYPPPPTNPQPCLQPYILREIEEKKQIELDAAVTEEEKEEVRKRYPQPVQPCIIDDTSYYPPNPPPPYVPPPPALPPYIPGFGQTTNNQPNANAAWEQSNGRPWTNYLENMGWTYTADYYNQIFGGNYYLIDLGVQENHIELLNTARNPPVTKVKRLPNVLADPGKEFAGFIDAAVLAEVGEDPYLEQNTGHGTPIASMLVGNTLGMSRNIQLWYSKIGSAEIEIDMQAVQNSLASINQLVGSNNDHKRPAVVVIPLNFQWSYMFCYRLRIEAGEAPCSMGIMDELASAYDKGTVVVLPSGNGFNHYDLLVNPMTGAPFTNTPISVILLCDAQPMSAVPIDICNTASRQHDLSFNVWDLYYPVHERTTKKPIIVAAHDRNNKISRWRNIQYSLSDLDWETPWWQMGSSNMGSCVDFSSFGIEISKSAATVGALEDSRYFSSYREKPYFISGTSYATATAASVAMIKMGLYDPSYYSLAGYDGNYVERTRSTMRSQARYVTEDSDLCRVNYWQSMNDLKAVPRLKLF